MNTEKIEKLKKSLSNSKIPADLKPKIEAEIKRLESLDDLATEKAKEEKEEAKEEAKPVAKTRKPRAKKTTTAKPSQTSKPKRTAMSVAKEIRKEGESWKDAQARASKMMKEGSKEVAKTVETELDKLSKLVKSKKELRSQIGRTNLLIDAKRKAKPMGRRISKDGNVYYENRANRTDRGTYGKYHLATGGYLTDPTFGNFQNQVFSGGGYTQSGENYEYINTFGIPQKDFIKLVQAYHKSPSYNQAERIESRLIFSDMRSKYGKDKVDEIGNYIHELHEKNNYATGGSVTNERRYVNKGQDYEVRYSKPILRRKGYQGKRDFELGGVMATDLAGHTGGGDAGFNAGMPLDGFSNTAYTGLVGETGAMSSGELFMAGGSVGNFDVKLLVGKRVVYEAKVDTLKKAQRIGSEILSWGDDGFEYTIIGYDSSNNKIFENKRLLSDEFPDRLKDKFATLKLNVIVANPKQNKLDAGSFTTYRALLNIVDDFEEANFRVTINGKTFYDDYELGGGLPSGAEQSYMITEALGNPAQHYDNGGGVNMIKNGDLKNDIKGKLRLYDEKPFINKTYDKYASNTQPYRLEVGDESYFYSQKTERDLDYETINKFFAQKFASGGGVRRVGNREYSYGRNWTNDHRHINKGEDHEVKYTRKGKFLGVFNDGGALTNERLHVNHDEDYEVRYAKPRPSRKGYKGARKFMAGGMNNETPRIYVADLEAYNNGRLVGEWLDLSDYNDADELMDAIQDVLKKSGGEEYAIHDVEYVPSSMYSEYMGRRDFEELYEMMELADRNDLPLEVVQDIVSQFDASAVDEFIGKYDSADDFAQQLVDDLGGIQNFNDFERYLTISETDRRLLSQEMADSYVDDIRDEDGGNRLIEEAGMDVSEYEEADSETQEEMLDKAREIVYDEYFDTWYEGLSDPYYFLVEEQGMYDAESFANANFVQVDYEDLGDALEDDYTYIFYNSDLYVFNIR